MSSPDITRASESEHPVDSRRSRLGDIQGLRAIAVLLVVVYHAGLPVPGGFVGVDVFFVISGFVITALLVRELRTHGRIRFARFYTRRVRRLLPALTVLLLVTGIASMALQSPLGAQQDTALAGIGSSAWLANAALYVITGDYFDNAADTIPLLHMWSLAVEEQFYLVFPALLLLGFVLARRLGRSGLRGATVIMTIAFALSFALSLWLSAGNHVPGIAKPQTAAFYLAPTRTWEFGAGALVAIWAARSHHLGRTLTLAAAAVGTALLAVSAVFIHSTTPFPGFAALVPVAGTALLIVAGRGESNAVSNLLGTRVLQRIGDLSYSWYLWHWPFIVFASLLWPDRLWVKILAAVVSLGAARLSYVFVEEPIRHRESTSGWATLRVVAAGVVAPLLAFVGLYAGASHSWGNDRIAAAAAQLDPVPSGYKAGCHNSTPVGDRDLSRCTFEGAAGSSPTYLVGDSNAGQYAEALVGAGRSVDQTVVLTTMSGCPFVDVTVVQPGVDAGPCRRFVDRSTSWFEQQPAATILLAAANEAIADPEISLRRPDGSLARSVQDKSTAWSDGLSRIATRLGAAGHHVVIVNVIPHLTAPDGAWWSPGQCTMPALLGAVSNCSTTLPLAEADRLQAPALEAEHRAARESGATELDLRGDLCLDGECRALRGDLWVYRDGLHISTTQSARLGGQFAKVLAASP